MSAAPAYDRGDGSHPTPVQQTEQPISNLIYNGSFGYISIYDEVDDAREKAVGPDGILTVGEAFGYMGDYMDILGGGVVDGILQAVKDAINGVVFSVLTVAGSTYRMLGHAFASFLNMAARPRKVDSLQNLYIDPAYAPAVRVYPYGRFDDNNITFKRPFASVWYLGTAPYLTPEVHDPWGYFNDGALVSLITDQSTHFAPYAEYVVSEK